MTINRPLLAVLAVLALVAAGCGGGASSPLLDLMAFDGSTFTITVGGHVLAMTTSGVLTIDGHELVWSG